MANGQDPSGDSFCEIFYGRIVFRVVRDQVFLVSLHDSSENLLVTVRSYLTAVIGSAFAV